MVKAENEFADGNYMDNGKKFYPKAVCDALHILHDDYKVDIPIYITENGTYNCNEEIADDGRIHDKHRIAYLRDFLYWTKKAMEGGIDVRGYYAWSLMDNWEWSVGYRSRFGLINVDFDTQKRTWKDSAYWYSQVIKVRDFQLEE